MRFWSQPGSRWAPQLKHFSKLKNGYFTDLELKIGAVVAETDLYQIL